MKELNFRHTVCRHKKPLVVLHNLPGEGAEMRPETLRQLAKALVKAADIAEQKEPSVMPSKNEHCVYFEEL